ncbi:MAG: cell envelope integrity protein CreD [Salinivirgaceae bacterium]|nr:cell envelope integrity protein CreD [Salinivirgaceae bacterium]
MFKNWIKESISFKLIVIGILFLLLMIPTSMIRSLIRERENRRDEVFREINSKWGNSQTIKGPVISIPYKYHYKEDDKNKTTIEFAHFLPENLTIKGDIHPEERYRSIYKVIVYNSVLHFSGNFKDLSFDSWKINQKDILWDEAYICIGIPDMRGINTEINIAMNENSYTVDPGVRSNDLIKSGVSAPIKINTKDSVHNFSFTLDVNGSETINFVPLGKTTNVAIQSVWTTPSFSGAFIPDNREISKDGFTADWKILHLNRNYPQKWRGAKYKINNSAFGVDLLLPVDHYLKSERAIKYAIMFIALTFLVFFFTEILNKKRIHPIQYLLIGIGLLIFYSLLISLSEHISFGWSYLIASTAIVTLITLYTKSTIGRIRITLTVFAILVALYVFLYTLLQLEDYSLLMGSIGIFVALSLVMYLSRKVDWFAPIQFDPKINKKLD